MTKHFNLIDSPWILVKTKDQKILSLGLRDVFANSANIVSLAETDVPALLAQYRILLAILHRSMCAVGAWDVSSRADWFEKGLDLKAINTYLNYQHEKFWLIHPEFPFMQIAAMNLHEKTQNKIKSWNLISMRSASGSNPVMFSHEEDQSGKKITLAQAANCMVGYLQCVTGGLTKTFRDSDKAGALCNTAAAVPLGNTLHETLALSLHPYSAADRSNLDLPAWEKPPAQIADIMAEPTVATGPNDRYTRQARGLLWLYDPEDSGHLKNVLFAEGLSLLDDENVPDPMASLRQGKDRLYRLTFSEGREFWRDMTPLMPNDGNYGRRASVLEYAHQLNDELAAARRPYQNMLVAGVLSDQAKILNFHLHIISLAKPIFENAGVANVLISCLAQSEDIHRQLKFVASEMVAKTMTDPSNSNTKSAARSVVEAGPLSTTFFVHLERSFTSVMELIGEKRFDEARTLWNQGIRSSAMESWNAAVSHMGGSVDAIRAAAIYTPRMHGVLHKSAPMEKKVDSEVLEH